MAEIEYKFSIVGGRWEGVEGLYWIDNGGHPTPSVILVGECAKGVDCGASACRRGKVEHVSFWTPDEDDRPLRVQRYEKERDELHVDDEGELHGKTTYAIGGLLDPRNRGALAHTPAGAGFAPATYAGARGWTGLPYLPAGADVRAPAAPLHPDYEMRA